ncbi:4-(cytidine 5'-diphospho)-2-C-methyl-D-erythritol kinase [Niabella yanshanensis]|uniref:4-diphosphocytidyl-2-C-methyl-D-erythritol kinase n=1 Tax=Niabella yanshanensis TaxID=577386 RepID=A0ABZ0W729_9BACT|nr:4-(cytidine 5'-diphospho)-2-C-methyl-D-erythritol kinase [Niabella yanshanensis]WQD38339.1 4-(cytidine 5'-diphospho)-2-C-methyl-D-erythritol kinase [Niabella yanshanensis]
MIRFSNCKINIGLYITGKRPDGYHNLETVFFPLPLYDVIELIEAPETAITVTGQLIPGRLEDNIIIKAWSLLKKDFPQLPSVHFYLLKNIPAGAGMGAGSANGAHTLIALNQKFSLQLTEEQLLQYALQLGSDCPFFILNRPVLATGRGEVFAGTHLDLSGYRIVIVNPGIHISTPWAFSRLQPATPLLPLEKSIVKPVQEWKSFVFNDFEAAVFSEYTEIRNIKELLYHTGAVYALMSGSGSTVYGIFEKSQNVILNFPENYFIRQINL